MFKMYAQREMSFKIYQTIPNLLTFNHHQLKDKDQEVSPPDDGKEARNKFVVK